MITYEKLWLDVKPVYYFSLLASVWSSTEIKVLKYQYQVLPQKGT